MEYSFEEVMELFDRFWDNGINKFGHPVNLYRVLNKSSTRLKMREMELNHFLYVAVEDEDYLLAAQIKKELDGIRGE